jgi:hypothetical protein
MVQWRDQSRLKPMLRLLDALDQSAIHRCRSQNCSHADRCDTSIVRGSRDTMIEVHLIETYSNCRDVA